LPLALHEAQCHWHSKRCLKTIILYVDSTILYHPCIQLKLPLQKHGEIGLPKNFIEIKHQNVSNPNRNGNGQQWLLKLTWMKKHILEKI
jgi:hypothetical protein